MSRFQAQSDEFLENILSDVLSKNTKRVITGGVKLFQEFLVENNVEDTIEEMSLQELDKYLRIFFGSIKKSSEDDNGLPEDYKVTSFRSIHYAIQKHIENERNVNIAHITINFSNK